MEDSKCIMIQCLGAKTKMLSCDDDAVRDSCPFVSPSARSGETLVFSAVGIHKDV